MRVLLIDDEQLYFKQLSKPLANAGYELSFADSGNKGLALISANTPDLIITDLRIPDLSGFEIIQRIRRDPRFEHIPVIFVTANDSLEDKLKAFELGADDYLVKPFQPEELVARLRILARRGQAIKIVHELESDHELVTTSVAVHSLRGGSGCSTLAVNLALAFNQIWLKPTILIDTVLAAGQVAMMLNVTPRATWQDLVGMKPEGVDESLLSDLAGAHSSGLSYFAAPKLPLAPDSFTDEFWKAILKLQIENNEFIVLDTSHDFTDVTISTLNLATYILLVVTPEMAALRAAIGALSIYDQLGYSRDVVKVVLNHNHSNPGIRQANMEKALGRPVDFVIPYEPKEVFKSINFGEPFILSNPEIPISAAIENMAYTLTNNLYKNFPPAAPTNTWKRVTGRLAAKN